MKVYRVSWVYEDSPSGYRQSWYGGADAATSFAQKLAAQDVNASIERMDVPTTKTELLRWLNTYADSF
jgi:hypothetical protein